MFVVQVRSEDLSSKQNFVDVVRLESDNIVHCSVYIELRMKRVSNTRAKFFISIVDKCHQLKSVSPIK